jgi:hypothetical protein
LTLREAVDRLGWRREAHPLAVAGPRGEELTVDVAVSPAERCERALVLSSGLHGVEGFFGSAVQLALLDRWKNHPESAPATRCVLLHALNPYGFAWLRRADENNVDPNRNFLFEGETYSGSPEGYARLNALLNSRWAPSRWEPFLLMALLTVARYGMPRLKQTVASGQYDFPQGLFYGGAEPSSAYRLLREHLDLWLGGSRQVVHLDFHTGLGRSAEYKLLLDYPPNDAQRAFLSRWFGSESFEVGHADRTSYDARGGLGRWCVGRRPEVDYLFATAEFGTYPPLTVFRALRAENQAHHWGRPDSRATAWAKGLLKEAFGPSSPVWREQVLSKSIALVEQAQRGLAAAPKPTA